MSDVKLPLLPGPCAVALRAKILACRVVARSYCLRGASPPTLRSGAAVFALRWCSPLENVCTSSCCLERFWVMERRTRLAILTFLFVGASSFGAVKLVPLLPFDGTNGTHPRFNLVQGKDGDFYGTALGGSFSDAGTVFKIDPDGQPDFVVPMAITNGRTPSGLILGSDGNFYCAAQSGGPYERGTIFRMTPLGKLTVVAVFDGTNGVSPSDLLQGTDGNFYGTTQYATYPSCMGNGSVFKMSPAGEITTLFTFSGTNGMMPSSLTQGLDGNLYGTTAYGGPGYSGSMFVNGTVFQITTNGVLTTLWNFSGGDGTYPESVIQASDGNLYGAAYYGGSNNLGTLFRLTTNGTFSIMHSFSPFGTMGNNSDGANPTAHWPDRFPPSRMRPS